MAQGGPRGRFDQGYGLVINARIDVFLAALLSGAGEGTQAELVPESAGTRRGLLRGRGRLRFPDRPVGDRRACHLHLAGAGAVNIVAFPQAPALPELAELGVARVSYGLLLHRDAMEQFGRVLASLAADASPRHR